MGINIQEKNGQIEFSEKQNHDISSLLQRYKHNELSKQMIESQMQKEPQLVQELEAEEQILNNQLKHIDKRLEDYKKAINKQNIDIASEMKNLREKYGEEKLMEMAKQTPQEDLTISQDGNNFIQTKKTTLSQEQVLILYASNTQSKNEILQRLGEIKQTLKQKEDSQKQRKETLESIKSENEKIIKFLKNKRQVTFNNQTFPTTTQEQIDKLLEAVSQSRNKQEKTAKEL